VSRVPALKRVGHKGADLIAPGNTAESFDAALDAGVDMIEFDVLPENRDGSGRLVLAHDYRDAHRREPTTLEEGLDHLAATAFSGIDLDVDLKLPGYEERVVEALRERGMVERALVSSQYPESLAAVRAAEPALRVGWSVPRAQRDYTAARPWIALPARAALAVVRRVLPGRAAAALRAGRCDAIMAHRFLVTPRLVRAIRAAGGELYVWTVDDAREIRRLESLGVTGVITNDPRLFV
jgi:glycerophosphoryl diester phosphodiesterase